jgi:RND family efflux transporter MFP subunit
MTSSSSSDTVSVRRPRTLRRIVFWALACTLVSVGALKGAALSAVKHRVYGDDELRPAVAPPGTVMARRAPLSLVLTQRGMLDCVRKTILLSKVEWETKLTHILPEGSFVKKGDIIAELDVSKLREEYGEEQVDVLRAETQLAAAQDALRVQEIENENLIATARLTKEKADLALQGFVEAEYPFQVSTLEKQIAAAADLLHSAQDKVDYTRRLFTKGYVQATDVNRDRLALNSASQKHSDLLHSLELLEKHTQKRTSSELTTGAAQAERALERTRNLAEAKLIARQMTISAYQRNVLRQKQQFEWATRMLGECHIKAPHDGQVVYPSTQSDNYETIAEGVRVKFLQPVAIIPDRSHMKVNVRVHETQRRLLRVGLPAIVRLDSDPRRELPAKVLSMSQFPVTGRYPNYDVREYDVVVQLEDGQNELTPGLTTKVDLIAASRENALQVPFDAVTEVDDCYLTFVRDGDGVAPREVTLGERSQDHVEILAGLDEGDCVVLDPRAHCADLIASWEHTHNREPVTQTALAE